MSLLFALSSLALAVPLELTHTGRLMDGTGLPLTGNQTLTFTIYDAETAGNSLWSDTAIVPFDDGYFAVEIGDGLLDADVFDNDLWLGLSVNGATELPDRQHIVSVPFARRAETAVDVDGGVVDASEIRVNGTLMIDSTGQIVSGDMDTLGDLVCAPDQIPLFDGTDWTCAPSSSTLSEQDVEDFITNGPIDLAALSTVDGQEIALGPHTIDTDTTLTEQEVEDFVTNGAIDLNVATTLGSQPISTGAHTTDTTLTEGDVETFITNGPLVFDLDPGSTIGGATISTGPHTLPGTMPTLSSPPQACDVSIVGNLYFDTSDEQIYGCNGTAWTPLGLSGATPGQAPADAESSCEAIKAAQPSSVSGVYWIDPSGSAPFEVWCEMSVAGGGWDLAMNLDTSDGNVRHFTDDVFWTATSSFGDVNSPFASDHKSGQVFETARMELLMVVHDGGTPIGWRTWDLASDRSLKDLLGHDQSRIPGWLTGPTTNSDVGSLDTREAVVRPGNRLYSNEEWGSTTSYDIARVRSAEMSATDNRDWGMGMQMDAQNNNQDPFYPGCDVASTDPWSGYFCISTDKLCNSGQCGSTSGGTQGLAYDYAIYVRGEVPGPDTTPSLLGNSAATAGLSCMDIHTQRATAPTGTYWVDPTGSNAYQVHCEMSAAGGGWTLMLNLDTADGNVRHYTDNGFWEGASGFGDVMDATSNDYKSAETFAGSWDELMISVHLEGMETLGWRAWSLPASTNFPSLFPNARSRTANVLTTGSFADDVGNIPGNDIVVRPAGNLHYNMEWGSGVSYDIARLRSDAIGGADNVNWGLGMQMDAQNNSQNPFYPGCDAAGTTAWSSYFCFGEDRDCSGGQCGSTTGGTLRYQLDYGIYVR